jgi:hypothetical protein
MAMPPSIQMACFGQFQRRNYNQGKIQQQQQQQQQITMLKSWRTHPLKSKIKEFHILFSQP